MEKIICDLCKREITGEIIKAKIVSAEDGSLIRIVKLCSNCNGFLKFIKEEREIKEQKIKTYKKTNKNTSKKNFKKV